MANEKRLIDANALLKVLKHRVKGNEESGIVLGTNSTLEIMEEWVRSILAVDAVEVVRCKDCRFYEEAESSLIGKVMCCAGQGDARIQKQANDFCSYGERRGKKMQNAECKMQNEQRLIDAKARGCNGEVKIKTHFTKIIVEETAGGLYYSILYYDPRRKQYYNGYGSYSVETVLEWFAEYFETVEAPAIDAVPTVDAVEVVRCKDCKSCMFCYPEKQIDKEATPAWYCKLLKGSRRPNDFCSYGERREGE